VVKAGNLAEADGSLSDAVDSTAAQRRRAPLPLLTAIAPEQWRGLAGRAIEPNGYYLPDWELAVNASARGLVLRNMSLDGPAMQAFAEVLRQQGLAPRVLQSHARACLDATRDADELLRDALGAKKLKELRRLRNRLAEHGEVTFSVAQTPADVTTGLEVFLELEASGWKARRGTALRQHEGDAAFIRRATAALAAYSQCEIVILRAGETPVAGAVVLRHQDRAFYFKIGIDERFAKLSPGVQLTLDLTRHLCADPAIRSADSTASAGHPMIDPIWRDRLAIGDVLIPLRPRDLQVQVIHAVLATRHLCRESLRRGLLTFKKIADRIR
jgi:hypothetical protein